MNEPDPEKRLACVVVDDHAAIIGLLGRVLPEAGIDVAAGVSDTADALDAIRSCSPDVVVLDARMPGTGGVDLAAQIADEPASVPVVMYTGVADPDLVEAALRHGVQGIVLKDTPVSEVVRAIKLVARGGSYVDAGLSTHLTERWRVGRGGLSDRQRKVLALLADGLGTSEVAEHLGISSGTARTHVGSAMAALGARNRVHAVALALRRGLIA